MIYLFSGLGADERVFDKLDFSGYDITFVQWIIPDSKESIQHYASRIVRQITSDNPVLIGLSFGGIVVVEVAKQIKTKQVILIASTKTEAEIPLYYKLAGKLRIHQLIPTWVLKSSNPITKWFFGVASPSEAALLKSILKETEPVFLRWAIDKIARWKNNETPQRLVHIHGTADRILPIRFVQNSILIRGGGHFMTLTKSDEVSQQLRELL